jgi:hypothetical protein
MGRTSKTFLDTNIRNSTVNITRTIYLLTEIKVKFAPEQAQKVQKENRSNNSALSLTSELDRVGNQRHGPATVPPGRRPCTHCAGGRVGPRAGLDGCGKSRLPPPPQRDSIPRPSSP